MSANVLVAFATSYGSTKQVAEVIAAMLREHGLEVETFPVRQVKSLEGYRAIVLGAPLYMLHWHEDALRFLSRHRQALTERPVAIFALGPLHDDAKELEDSRAQLESEMSKSPWLTPIAVGLFGGAFDPAKIRFPWRMLPAVRSMPASDVRDWDAISVWAEELAGKLALVMA